MSTVQLVSEVDDSAWRVLVPGELDLATTPELQGRLAEAERNGGRMVLVDMSRCLYIDSTGIAVLLNASRRLTRSGGALAIICPNRTPLRVFEMTSTVETLNVAETEHEARQLALSWRDRLRRRQVA